MKKLLSSLILATALCISMLGGAFAQNTVSTKDYPLWVTYNAAGLPISLGGASTATTSLASPPGTTTNDAAAAGTAGELLTITVPVGSAVAGAATTVSKNLTSLSLTAGDWDVSASCVYALTGVTASVYSCGLGTTTATQASQAGGSGIGTDPLVIQAATFGTTITGTYQQVIPPVRVTLAATTTIYLVANHTFAAGTYAMYGTLRARRMR